MEKTNPKEPEVKINTSKEPEKKKRGQYRKKECPYCHKHFGNLENHIKLAHPAEHQEKPPETITKEALLTGKKPEGGQEPPPPGPGNPPIYYHKADGCNAELRWGENPCWKCGQYLAWGMIDEGE